MKKNSLALATGVLAALAFTGASCAAILGETWRPVHVPHDPTINQQLPPRTRHATVEFKAKLWAIAGWDGNRAFNDIWGSNDGRNWSLVAASSALPPIRGFNMIVFDEKLWVVGSSTTWSTVNGIDWVTETSTAEFGNRGRPGVVVFDDRLWVIGGSGFNDVWSSGDGVTWVQETPNAGFPTSHGKSAVVHDDAIWVLANLYNDKNEVWSSTDGVNWNLATDETPFPVLDFPQIQSFDGKIWIAGDQSSETTNQVWSSEDGVTWTEASSVVPFAPRSGHTLFTFQDKLWIQNGIGPTNVLGVPNSLNTADTWFTADGETWEPANPLPVIPAGSPRESLTFGGRQWIYMMDGSIWSSGDDGLWIQEAGRAAYGQRASGAYVVHDEVILLIGGGYPGTASAEVWSSSDGKTFTLESADAGFGARAGNSSANISVVAYDGYLWLVGGNGADFVPRNDVWRSIDGIVWEEIDQETPFEPRRSHALADFDGKLWIVGGFDEDSARSGEIYWSTDGKNWTEVEAPNLPPNANTRLLVDGQNLLLSAGSFDSFSNREIFRTSDGASWTSIAGPIGPANSFGTVFARYGDGFHFLVTQSYGANSVGTDIYRSTDAINWELDWSNNPLRLREQAYVGELNGRLWAFGSPPSTRDIMSSADGIEWEQVVEQAPILLLPRRNPVVLSKDGKLWIFGGNWSGSNRNDVWSSSDGTTWTRDVVSAAFPARTAHAGAVFQDAMWIVGGLTSSGALNDVWKSDDGLDWEQVTAAAPFTPRSGHTLTAHNGRLWVIGGYDNFANEQPIWHSEDGLNWFSIQQPLEISLRGKHQTLSHDGFLWIIGGEASGAGFRSDIWRSPDGEEWQPVSRTAGFLPRRGHAALVRDGNLMVFGGETIRSNLMGQSPLGDIWISSNAVVVEPKQGAVNFGSVDVSAIDPVERSAEVENRYPQSWAVVTPSAISIEEDATGAFSFLDEPDMLPLLLGEVRELNLGFQPTQPGLATATLRIEFRDDVREPILVPLSGVGSTPTGVPGDVNGDGVLNVADVTLLGNYLNEVVPALPGDPDFNGDGAVDHEDLTALATYIANR